jgi:hypothetical protein
VPQRCAHELRLFRKQTQLQKRVIDVRPDGIVDLSMQIAVNFRRVRHIAGTRSFGPALQQPPIYGEAPWSREPPQNFASQTANRLEWGGNGKGRKGT